MSDQSAMSLDQSPRVLTDDELHGVIGGTEGYPGLPFGTSINVSPFAQGPFDRQWALVGATGHLPR
jgi:hypothetical protein